MNHTNTHAHAWLQEYMPARVAGGMAMPWIQESPVKWWKPLRFMPEGRGFVELMRMSPGAVMPLHRHTGEIHAFNLEGERVLCTGERIGPGDYVYEPPGNTDWWRVEGDKPLTVLVVVHGEVEFLAADGAVRKRVSAQTQLDAYRRHCEAQGLPIADLMEPSR
ncbi:cupin domain-containing protein [Trinickia terrae]|uniref:Cupin domain-containing protein n=1 Tax=Trinickia terrae TaxID=2571161 RepID=A0A4V5PL15_9BURK|nr:cupin domain-containing protein [Trinickia terrae]TKC91670.1 cupin domain-containing protein [Trinickia terrae]